MQRFRKWILFLLLIFTTVFPGSAHAAEGGESQSWLGRQLQSGYQFVVDAIKNIFDGAIDFFQGIWDKAKGFFETIVKLIGDAWEWAKTQVEYLYNFILKWVVYYGEYLLDWFFTFLDWLVGLVMDSILWVADQFPEIELPEGFEDGIIHLITYAMILDDIAPVTELFALLVLYGGIYGIVILYRIIKSFIPGIST